MNNRSVPANILLPHIVYRDVIEASSWLERAFGFKEHYRYGNPVSGIQMHLGEAWFMLMGPRLGTESPTTLGAQTQMLTIFVEDVEAHYARSRQQGAAIFEALNETIYGELQYGVTDLDGHRWLFSRHAKDIAPEQWRATIAGRQP